MGPVGKHPVDVTLLAPNQGHRPLARHDPIVRRRDRIDRGQGVRMPSSGVIRSVTTAFMPVPPRRGRDREDSLQTPRQRNAMCPMVI